MLLDNSDEYQYWRDEKLTNTTTELTDCIVEIQNPFKLTPVEKNKLQSLCQKVNFALFQIQPIDQYDEAIISNNTQLGLKDFDQHLLLKQVGWHTLPKVTKKTKANLSPTPTKT